MRRKLQVALMGLALAAQAAAMPAVAQDGKDVFIREYMIGAKDLLEIKVVEVPQLNLVVRVSEDGSVTLPLLGRIDLGGLAKEVAEQRIATRLIQGNYVKNPQVTIFIRDYQSNRVVLLGAVRNPGMYELIGQMSLLELVSKAGGLLDSCGREVLVMRAGKSGPGRKITVDLDDLVLNGNQSLNIILQPMDVVSVPPDKTIEIYVWGEVRKPGALSVKASKKISLVQAVAQAGGTTEAAKKSAVVLKRRDDKTGKETRITVNMNKIMKGRRPDIPLMEGDIVYVPASFW